MIDVPVLADAPLGPSPLERAEVHLSFPCLPTTTPSLLLQLPHALTTMPTAHALLHPFRQGRPTGRRAFLALALNSARLSSSRHIFTTPRLQQPSTQRITVKGDRGTDSEIPTGIFYDGKWQKCVSSLCSLFPPLTSFFSSSFPSLTCLMHLLTSSQRNR